MDTRNKEMGSWEKHTKGFGAKMLNKFGFNGRLGANEDGVSRAIEVSVRPNGIGLGYGGITEASALPVNRKIEAEWRGVEYVEPQLPLSSSSSIRKNKNEKGKKRKKLSVVELLMEQEMLDQAKEKKIKQTKQKRRRFNEEYVEEEDDDDDDDDDDNNDNDEEDDLGVHFISEGADGPDVPFNSSMLLAGDELEIQGLSTKLYHIIVRIKAIRSEIGGLKNKIEFDSAKAHRLEGLRGAVQGMRKVVTTALGQSYNASVQREAIATLVGTICSSIIDVFEKYPEECIVFGVVHLVPIFAQQILLSQITTWQPLIDPYLLIDYLSYWKPLEDYFESHDRHQLKKQAHDMVLRSIESQVLPSIKRCLVSEWSVDSSNASAVLLITIVSSMLHPRATEDITNNSVMPKLSFYVSSWTPSEKSTLHDSIKIWAPILGDRLGSLFPEIRQKISQSLSSWNGIQSFAINIVKPWKSLFDAGSFNNLIFRVIIPKLITALRSLIINPQNQDISIITALLEWVDVIPKINFCALLVGEFFPNWLNILYIWLSSSPALDEVSEWYIGWKSLLPESISEDPSVATQFNVALDMMEASISGQNIQHPYKGAIGIKANSYVAIMEAIVADQRLQERMKEFKKGDLYFGEGR